MFGIFFSNYRCGMRFPVNNDGFNCGWIGQEALVLVFKVVCGGFSIALSMTVRGRSQAICFVSFSPYSSYTSTSMVCRGFSLVLIIFGFSTVVS